MSSASNIPGDYHLTDPDEPFSYANVAEYHQDTMQYTLMSYFSAANTGADHGDPQTWSPSTYQLHDILALQSLYGANMTTRTGDNVYGFNSNAGANYALDSGPRSTGPVFCIWDAGGFDTLDLSGYDTASNIDLNEGAFSDAGGMGKNISIAFGVTIENAVGGGGDDSLTGSSVVNRLRGGRGDDRLDGGGASDILAGGAGNDVYLVSGKGDKVVELASQGSDTIEASVSYALSAHVENLILAGSAANGTGNGRANFLTGNGAANTLDGRGSADTMRGWGGNDRYVVDNIGDRVIEDDASGGVDSVSSRVSFTLGADVENLKLTDAAESGTGNGLANLLTGNGAINALNGRGGADTMRGWGGNDRYVVNAVGDKVIEDRHDGGTDTVSSWISFTLGANVENLTLAGGAGNGTGNGLANLLIGNGAANVLKGGAGGDTLRGGSGGDKLHGGAGLDTLKGGIGADRFYFDEQPGAANVDLILDFSRGSDKIVLENSVFRGLAEGALTKTALAIGTAATSAAHRIIYDPGTGALSYDPDGTGAAAAIRFATLDNQPASLSASDFTVI